MKKLFVSYAILVLIIASDVFGQNLSKLPKGWYIWGSKPSEYEMGVDKTVSQNGKASAFVKSTAKTMTGFGTLSQYISADNYVGKRLRLSGSIKSDKVEGWSGMWMRIDGKDNKQLGFDNMMHRAIKGTTNWNKYEVVLDIPEGSKGIAFGVLLDGKGEVWFDDMKMEAVDDTVPVTNMNTSSNLSKEPVNMNFEE